MKKCLACLGAALALTAVAAPTQAAAYYVAPTTRSTFRSTTATGGAAVPK